MLAIENSRSFVHQQAWHAGLGMGGWKPYPPSAVAVGAGPHGLVALPTGRVARQLSPREIRAVAAKFLDPFPPTEA